jgi:NADPH:quinone reductase-like Zn-dependent oxidoreductase
MSLPASIPPTHSAIAVAHARSPLVQITLPTHAPLPSEALVRVTWTSSSPVELHHADAGLLLPPTTTASSPANFVLGCTFGGTVVALGEAEQGGRLAVGDHVFGFVQDGDERQSGFQEYATVPAWRVSKLPAGWEMRDAVTVPGNLVTAVHAVTEDLGLELAW